MKQIRLLLVAIFAATMYPAAYGQQPSVRNIPADKKEIIDRFIAGTLDPSYTPALFFGHFGNGKKLGEGALKAHLSLFRKGGADILKVQTEQPMPRVQDLLCGQRRLRDAYHPQHASGSTPGIRR